MALSRNMLSYMTSHTMYKTCSMNSSTVEILSMNYLVKLMGRTWGRGEGGIALI